MHAIWSGAIGFGLVNIPVKMYSATQESTLDLDMLDKNDNANIKYQRINARTGKEVEWKDIVKGYKLNNRYVVLDEEDFAAASAKKSQVIEIDSFIESDQLDTVYYETPYFITPAKGGERAYILLRDALEETGKMAIGSYVMRGKEHVCILRSYEDAIMLQRIRFARELRSPAELELPSHRSVPKASEMKMAVALINQLTAKKFSLEKYKDTYHDELLKVIRKKAKTGKAPVPEFKLVYSKSKDLMAQLKASLEGDTEEKPIRRKAS